MNAMMTKKPMSMKMDSTCLLRCEMRMERCEGGCKITCSCDNADDCCSLQAICEAMAGKMCCMTCSRDGEMICHCSMSCCGNCECKMTADGVCISCTSADCNCADLIQAMCDCIRRCQACGCECTLCFDEKAVCCC